MSGEESPSRRARLDSDAINLDNEPVAKSCPTSVSSPAERVAESGETETGRASEFSIFISKVRRAVSVPSLGITRSFHRGKKRVASTEHATVEPISLEFNAANLEEDYRADQEEHIMHTLSRWFAIMAFVAVSSAVVFAILPKYNNAFAFGSAGLLSIIARQSLRRWWAWHTSNHPGPACLRARRRGWQRRARPCRRCCTAFLGMRAHTVLFVFLFACSSGVVGIHWIYRAVLNADWLDDVSACDKDDIHVRRKGAALTRMLTLVWPPLVAIISSNHLRFLYAATLLVGSTAALNVLVHSPLMSVPYCDLIDQVSVNATDVNDCVAAKGLTALNHYYVHWNQNMCTAISIVMCGFALNFLHVWERRNRLQFRMKRKLEDENWDMHLSFRDPFADNELLSKLFHRASQAKRRFGRGSLGLPQNRTTTSGRRRASVSERNRRREVYHIPHLPSTARRLERGSSAASVIALQADQDQALRDIHAEAIEVHEEGAPPDNDGMQQQQQDSGFFHAAAGQPGGYARQVSNTPSETTSVSTTDVHFNDRARTHTGGLAFVDVPEYGAEGKHEHDVENEEEEKISASTPSLYDNSHDTDNEVGALGLNFSSYGSASKGTWLISERMIEVFEMMNRGAQGTVHRAMLRVMEEKTNMRSNIEVAVKRSYVDAHAQQDLFREVRAEASVMWKIDHPNVLKFYGVCIDPPHMSLVVDIMDGSLEQLIHRPPDDFEWNLVTQLTVAVQMARGLLCLHKNGIVHRDLKPANVLYKNGIESIKLCDFGTSKSSAASTQLHMQCTANQGTPAYMAPELVVENNRRAADLADAKKLDIFAFGVVLNEMWTRQKPYNDLRVATTYQMMNRIAGGLRPTMSDGMPEGLRSLIQSCWDPEPGKRPSCSELSTTLHRMMMREMDAASSKEGQQRGCRYLTPKNGSVDGGVAASEHNAVNSSASDITATIPFVAHDDDASCGPDLNACSGGDQCPRGNTNCTRPGQELEDSHQDLKPAQEMVHLQQSMQQEAEI